MKSIYLAAMFYFFAGIVTSPVLASEQGENPTYTYVFVHGVTGGAWDWKGVSDLLTQYNHVVYRATLTGLGERVHLASPDISLTTHIDDVVNLILFEDLNNVILVGHSYAGMVITGVMDRIPERLAGVFFLDASVPEDGMSATDLWGPLSPDIKVEDGLVYFPWLDSSKPYPRDVPQPQKTLTEPVSFKNPKAMLLPVTYIAFVAPQDIEKRSNSDSSWKRAKERNWEILTLNSDHNAQRSHPTELVEMLEVIPNRK